MSAENKYTPEEAKKLGYDWIVVQHFLKYASPELLEKMWGNPSVHYDTILKNEVTLMYLVEYLATLGVVRASGNIFRSSVLMAQFLVMNAVKEEKKDTKK